jgi:acyl-CoA thioesterase-1
LLAGMLAPRNLGAEYAAEFDAVFPRLAEAHGVGYYPFFLDGVALRPAFNQADGIHPNEAGVAVIVERILPSVIRLLESETGNAPRAEKVPGNG